MIRVLREDRGAVSLIAVIITAVLFSIITTGLTRGLSTEIGQTIDTSASARAYYAAEAGVEDALQRIKDHSACPAASPGCDPSTLYYYTETPIAGNAQGASRADHTGAVVGSPIFRHVEAGDNLSAAEQADDPGAKWIDRSIQLTSQSSEGLLKVSRNSAGSITDEETHQLDFSQTGISKITIEWDEAGDSSKQGSWLTTFPSNWAQLGEPAALEATLVSWGETGGNVTNFDPVAKYLGRACNTDSSCGGLPGNMTITYDGSRHYHLKWDITGLDVNKFYVLRLRAKYNSTHYRVTAYNSLGQSVDIPDNYITIDVTGKAGDTYRRIVVKKRYQAGIFSIFDFVLASQQDLCKSFSVYSDFSIDANFCS